MGEPAGPIPDSLNMQIGLGRWFSLEAVCVISDVGPAMSIPTQQGSSPVWTREQWWALQPPTPQLPPHF